MFAAPLPRIFSMEKAAYPLGIVLYFVQKILQLYAFNKFENSLLLSVQEGFLQIVSDWTVPSTNQIPV